jgi:hypothetical protein
VKRINTMRPPSTQKSKAPTRKALIRAIASSTAVETGQSIQALEKKLLLNNLRFAHIKLAR